MKPLRLTLLLTAIILGGTIPAHAATLFGKVIEVTEGDVLTVMNMKRPARIRLIGVDAPEKNQPFGDVARQHLSDLVLGQNVVVEYSGLGRDGTIVGRVLLNSGDMNAQMIRDGAAWFDPSFKGELGEENREIYFQSEQAAKNEKRGLWQEADAIAPWEFVKAQAERQSTAWLTAHNRRQTPKQNTEFTSLNLFPTLANGVGPTASVFKGLTDEPAYSWEDFRFPNEQFGARVPSGGHLEAVQPEHDTLVRVYVASDRRVGYAMFVSDATEDAKYSDGEFIKGVVSVFGQRQSARDQSCVSRPATDIKRNGYVGAMLDLRDCEASVVVSGFTKWIDGRRRIYLAAIFNTQDNEKIGSFLKSIVVGAPANTVKKSAK